MCISLVVLSYMMLTISSTTFVVCRSQPYYPFYAINCLELRRERSLDVAVGTVTRLWARRFGFQLLVGAKPPE
jgi:hypothetical protein